MNTIVSEYKKFKNLYETLGFVCFSASLSMEKNKKGKMFKKFNPSCLWKSMTKTILNIKKNCIFIATGKLSNCTVIDIDDMSLETSQQLYALCVESSNMIVKTKKGFHFYYAYDGMFSTSKDIIQKVDIRNDGGAIIAPPTFYYYKNENNQSIKQKYELIKAPENDTLNNITDDIRNFILSNMTEKNNKIKKSQRNLNNSDAIVCNKDFIKLDVEVVNKLLNIMADNRYSDYDDWRNVMFALKCENNNDYFECFDNFSKKWSDYIQSDVIRCWNNYTPNPDKNIYTYNSLLYWAKSDNAEEYEKICVEHKLFGDNNDDNSFEVVEGGKVLQINQDYLLMGETSNVHDFLDDYLNDNTKSLNIWSPYNTGKTTLLKSLCDKFDKILFISYRVTLTNNLIGGFKDHGFVTYFDNINADKLICQVDSLGKLIDPNRYQLIIIDEIESVLNHLSSPTISSPKYIFDLMVDICASASKIINLDGDMGARTLLFSEIFGEHSLIKNSVIKNPKHYVLHCKEAKYDELIDADLKAGKNICIVSMSSKNATHYYNLYKHQYKSILYTATTDDKQKKDLANVSIIWTECQLLIYSPCIESGVDYNVDNHFDKLYIVLSSGSTSQRGLSQMENRIRKVADNNVNVFVNNIAPNVTSVKRHYNIDEIKAFYNNIAESKDIMAKNPETNKLEVKNNFSVYEMILMYNKMEKLNKNPNCFLPILIKNFWEKKGHTYSFYDDCKKIQKKKISSIDGSIIVSVKSISNIEFEALKLKQKNHTLTQIEKYQMQKFVYENVFNVSIDDISVYKHVVGRLDAIRNLLWLKEEEYVNGFECNLKVNERNEKFNAIRSILNHYGISVDALIKNNFTIDFTTLENSVAPINNIVKSNKIVLGVSKTVELDTTTKVLGTLKTLLRGYGIDIASDSIPKKINGKTIRIKSYVFSVMDEIKNKLNVEFEDCFLD